MATARLTFRRSQRLTQDRQYRAVQASGVRSSSGPLTMIALPNALPRHRLGLSISRRVGGAVVRNRLKRMMRECFRLLQHELPVREDGGYDLVISARAHEAKSLDEYLALFRGLARRVHEASEKKSRRGGTS